MPRTPDNPWLHRFACLTALTTLGLVCLGGVVTSKGVGMAVPDWPTTYGENMFLFPPSKWVGGVFYEHTHRLLASAVGLLTTVLAGWLWRRESRAWLRNLGGLAFLFVVVQGVLGGLRVVWDKFGLGPHMGVFHGTVAQLFFVLTCFIALATSRWWNRHPFAAETSVARSNLAGLFLGSSLLILVQLALGATMRHQHAGLAVPDFPLAHGKLWPDTGPAAIARYNQTRMEMQAYNPITAFQIHLHMTHRVTAFLILGLVAWTAARTRSQLGSISPWSRGALIWLGLLAAQAGLGILTVLSAKKVDVTTAHVAVGASSLALGALLALTAFRCRREALTGTETEPAGSPPRDPALR